MRIRPLNVTSIMLTHIKETPTLAYARINIRIRKDISIIRIRPLNRLSECNIDNADPR